jgi:hypothetical protein
VKAGKEKMIVLKTFSIKITAPDLDSPYLIPNINNRIENIRSAERIQGINLNSMIFSVRLCLSDLAIVKGNLVGILDAVNVYPGPGV